MRISLNWLKDYLDIKSDIDVLHIAESLTLAGLEVEGIEYLSKKAALINIARICEKTSESMYLIESQGEKFQIKGDAFNLSPDSFVGIIMSGSGFRVAHYGDLGFSASQQDIINFNAEYFSKTGIVRNLSDLPEFNDTIFSLGVTPNRPDALSHLGVSRELAALLDLTPRVPLLSLREMAGPTHEKAVVEIDNSSDCPRYALRVIENIRVEPSPLWIRVRLLACGIRPINNIVDVTNYVMLSRGQPMHAYDFDKLKKENSRVKIIIRKAHAGESLLSLDNKNLSLNPDDVVIADTKGAIALAGIMGGALSAVSESTTTVLLESAFFDPKKVRMSARRHQISSESSYRFERGADPNGVLDALNYAARLLVENSESKSCREPIDAYRQRIDPIEIKMRLDRAQNILGIDAEHFDQELLRRKFLRLGIETVAKRGDAIYFRVPTFRADLVREIDLIEEAARMIGYDKVSESSVSSIRESHVFANKSLESALKKIRSNLVAHGFCESMNYAFLNKEFQEHFIDSQAQERVIELMNPLSDRYGVMRLSLIPGLIKNLIHNQRNQERSVQLFEIASIFLGKREHEGVPRPELLSGNLDQDSFAEEKQMLAGVMSGFGSYSAFDYAPKAIDFYTVKGIMSDCLKSLSLSDNTPWSPIFYKHGSKRKYLHPGESARIMLEDQLLGHLGKLHPDVALTLDITNEVFVFELDLSLLAKTCTDVKKFHNFSRFPIITRDLALLADEHVFVKDITDQAYEVTNAREILLDLSIFDVYRGKNIPAGKKSIALSLTLQKADRTLTDEEAESFVAEFLKLVQQKTKAHVR